MVSLQEGFVVLQPLVIFVIWMLVYSVFVFKFYKLVSRKNMLRISWKSDGWWNLARYVIKYLLLFPITVFIWFIVISALLAVLSQVLEIGDIFMISMGITVLIRITAYYNEDLSEELASMIPFALLAVFILDISQVTSATLFRVYDQVPGAMHILVYYFIFIVMLEIFLEILAYVDRKIDERK